jgi:hypothetical protein
MTNDKKDHPYNVNVTSNYQSGGITAHTVIVNAKPQRQLGPEARTHILETVPTTKEVVVWTTMGHEESLKLATEIFNFMKEAGYRLFGGAPMPQMFIPQLFGLRIRQEKERTEIDVGLMDGSETPTTKSPAGTRMTI